MMRSLVTDPMSWWPLGFVIGGVFGAIMRRHDQRRAGTGQTATVSTTISPRAISGTPDSTPDGP